jgi:histidinol dehydrogenase
MDPISPPLIDARGAPQDAVHALRQRLGPQAQVVSQAGRRRTIEVFGEPLSPAEVVQRICADVREKGLAAVLDYTARLDRVVLSPETVRVASSEMAEAHAAAAPEFLDALRRVRRNILDFQEAILHRDVRVDRPHGAFLAQHYSPLARVGVCVPGGAAAYPSTVLMTVVPAQAAGVAELAVVAPPTPFGAGHPLLLATCRELGVTELYRIGGAQAVAALAYGVEGIKRVDKIVGPGNLFVALAKRHVYGEVDVDAIAGPSEIVVVADESARGDFIAADLIAQAEHSPGVSILISWSDALLQHVGQELVRQAAGLDRGEQARQCLAEFGALVQVRDARQAAEMVNGLAPEHLHLAVENPAALLPWIRFAGAVFLGHYSPVAAGDYAAGPSHVLPTGGTARFASGLSANDFLRSNSVIAISPDWLRELAGDICQLAEAEGLTGHRDSVTIRQHGEGSN